MRLKCDPYLLYNRGWAEPELHCSLNKWCGAVKALNSSNNATARSITARKLGSGCDSTVVNKLKEYELLSGLVLKYDKPYSKAASRHDCAGMLTIGQWFKH